MIGKTNIVFGFLFLIITASLGPYMVATSTGEVTASFTSKQKPVGRIQALKTNEFEEELEPLSAAQIAKANTDAVLAINTILNTQRPHGQTRYIHAHGNLEAVLNILAGLVLCFIAVAKIFKHIISWCFILGNLCHAGMLFLLVIFEQSWAQYPLYVGPWLILAGLLFIAIAAAVGFKGEIVKDS